VASVSCKGNKGKGQHTVDEAENVPGAWMMVPGAEKSITWDPASSRISRRIKPLMVGINQSWYIFRH
jgi:hypothetical protein